MSRGSAGQRLTAGRQRLPCGAMHLRALLLVACLSSASCVEPYEDLFRPVPIGDSPVRGPADAWVTIVEFADFECPYCARAADTIAEIEFLELIPRPAPPPAQPELAARQIN